MFATIAGNFQMVELLTENGAQFGYSDPRYGTSALSLANAGENEKIKAFLYMHDTFDSFIRMYHATYPASSVQREEVGSRTDLSDALLRAASSGLVAEVRRLLKCGVSSNGKPGKDIPLISAARGGHAEAVKALISSGANIDCISHDGKTALGWASALGRLDIIKVLCDDGADTASLDRESRTVISHAAESGREEGVRLLIDLGARKENVDKYWRTPLWYAVARGHGKVVDLLLEKGSNVECADFQGWTPLAKAAATGDWGLCDTLLRKGAQMRTETYGNRSPLSLAVTYGHEPVVELLIDHGADLNHAARQGSTPLMLAVQNGHAMVVKILVEMGADTGIKDNYNRTATSYAKELCQEATLNLLSQAGALRSRNERALKRMKDAELARRMQHQYEPLQKGFIRILELHPGKTGDVISCELHNVDLLHDRSLPFDALSYEWKGRIGTVPVQCNQDRLLITPNCKAALKRLRDEKQSRMLWIDAICVNQEDAQECSSQVAMMNKIFRTAKAVLMWLGEDEENANLAFNSISILAHAYDQADQESFDQRGPPTAGKPFNKGAILEALDRMPKKDRVVQGWTALANRTYFQRVWIFQEVILARSRGIVMCGSLSSPWDSFKAALRGFMAWQNTWVYSIYKLLANDDDYRKDGELDFARALEAMATFQCSDARDKIFATLGLVEQDQQNHIVADYTNTIQEVTVKANKLIIGTYGWLWHWQFSLLKSPTGLQGLPSWATDFTKKLLSPVVRRMRPVDFTGFLPCETTASSTTLQVPGCILDRIILAVTITREKETFDIVKPVVQAMSRLHRGVYDPYPSAGKPDGDRCRSRQKRTNGQARLGAVLGWNVESLGEERYFGSFLASKLSRDDDIPDGDISKQPPSYFQSRVTAWNARSLESNTYDLDVCRSMESRQLYGGHVVYTEKGYLGISADDNVGEGMVVAVVGGARNLAVLRERTEGADEWYERCGQAFLFGWDEQRIKTLKDIDGNAEVAKLEIR